VPIPSPVDFVDCGGEHTAAITGLGAAGGNSSTPQLYMWGRCCPVRVPSAAGTDMLLQRTRGAAGMRQ
jgi:hypothetical protein